MSFPKDALTEKIIECIIEVHNTLGPGFLENIYRNSLCIELERHGLRFEQEKPIEIFYNKNKVGIHRLDLLVENMVIIELKTVERLSRIHYAQVRSYCKASGIKIGLLINFTAEKADFRRIYFPNISIPTSPSSFHPL